MIPVMMIISMTMIIMAMIMMMIIVITERGARIKTLKQNVFQFCARCGNMGTMKIEID